MALYVKLLCDRLTQLLVQIDKVIMYYKTTSHRHFVLSVAFTALLSLMLQRTVSAEALHPDGLTAKEIIERMAEVYADSKSYTDSAVVKTVFIRSESRRTVEKPFTTAFIRPDQFRFEFKEKIQGNRERRFIIYRKAKDVQTYWNVDKDLKLESIDRAVAAATGVSGGSAMIIPAMLIPNEIKWRRAIRFHKPERIGDDIFDEVDCFRIHDIILVSPVTFWIEKKTFLLRKIFREQEFEDFRTQQTTTYKPILNGKVMDNMLEFNPPKDKP